MVAQEMIQIFEEVRRDIRVPAFGQQLLQQSRLRERDLCILLALDDQDRHGNLADSFRSRGIDYTPLLFESTQDTNTAYEEGRADAETSDKSQLAALRSAMANPDEHVILDLPPGVIRPPESFLRHVSAPPAVRGRTERERAAEARRSIHAPAPWGRVAYARRVLPVDHARPPDRRLSTLLSGCC